MLRSGVLASGDCVFGMRTVRALVLKSQCLGQSKAFFRQMRVVGIMKNGILCDCRGIKLGHFIQVRLKLRLLLLRCRGVVTVEWVDAVKRVHVDSPVV
jgi:hypothetical protein